MLASQIRLVFLLAPLLVGLALPKAVAMQATPPDPVDLSSEESSRRLVERLLRSNCRDGYDQARALAANERDAGRPGMFVTLADACSAVLAAGGSPPPSLTTVDREGRSKLVFASTGYGLWMGIALDVIADVDDLRVAVLPPLLGMGLGLTTSLLGTRQGEMTNGQAWTIITGLDYGTYSGLLWAGAAGAGEARTIMGAGLGGGLLGGAAAVGIAKSLNPSHGDAEVLRSGGLWGFATGAVLYPIFLGDDLDEQHWLASMAIGMDGGLIVGALVANATDVSRNRMLLVDAGALAGGVVGLGFALLIAGESFDQGTARLVGASALVGLYSGMGAAIYFTRDMRGEKENRADSSVSALLERDRAGHWQMGEVAFVPVLSPGRTRHVQVTGATLTLVGGAW